jgi:GST-like protein
MFGQFGHFYKYAGDKCDHPYPTERYTNEAKRLLKVLDERLEDRTYIMDDEYTIADIAIFPWVDCLSRFYEADEQLELAQYTNVKKWLGLCLDKPATQRGYNVCGFN